MQAGWNLIELPRMLPVASCRALLARAEAVGFAPMARLYPDGDRNNDRRVIDDPVLAGSLFDQMAPRLPQTLTRDGRRYRLRRFNSRFRFCRYQGGQAFTVHRDGLYVPGGGERSLM